MKRRKRVTREQIEFIRSNPEMRQCDIVAATGLPASTVNYYRKDYEEIRPRSTLGFFFYNATVRNNHSCNHNKTILDD